MDCCLTEYTSCSPEDTADWGEKFGRTLKGGSVIALYGALGAGKTCLVKGIARALGITENITSPTYTIINEYRCNNNRITLYHIDAYRLSGDDDFNSTGAGECIGGEGITIIEWSERLPRSIPPDAITIHITITGPQSRVFRINEPARH